jgi:hypothetical protein
LSHRSQFDLNEAAPLTTCGLNDDAIEDDVQSPRTALFDELQWMYFFCIFFFTLNKPDSLARCDACSRPLCFCPALFSSALSCLLWHSLVGKAETGLEWTG